ncbi:MAG: nitrous oxide reductase accessory protein NosL [Deltaproteobacteria bacterium]|nr:nitrous oxide reductase accessory protein NosL [Deltaproteobacteria bacterium]
MAAAVLSLSLLTAQAAPADDAARPLPGPKDKCPVCGMFVAKYPDWTASVVYADGRVVFFDGAKDLFKYILHLDRYERERTLEQVRSISVCSYYLMEQVPASEAWFVIGSDVFGPMGRELIPLESREEAEEFMRDHRGEKIVRFEEVDDALLTHLDR